MTFLALFELRNRRNDWFFAWKTAKTYVKPFVEGSRSDWQQYFPWNIGENGSVWALKRWRKLLFFRSTSFEEVLAVRFRQNLVKKRPGILLEFGKNGSFLSVIDELRRFELIGNFGWTVESKFDEISWKWRPEFLEIRRKRLVLSVWKWWNFTVFSSPATVSRDMAFSALFRRRFPEKCRIFEHFYRWFLVSNFVEGRENVFERSGEV